MVLEEVRTTFRTWIAKWLIHLKKLTHVDYSVREISDLITPHLPISIPITVPKGEGNFTLSKVNISIPKNQPVIQAELFGGVDITYLANPIYRAHIVIVAQAKPSYDKEACAVCLKGLSITDIYMLNDEYSVIKDTTNLINQLIPSPVISMVTGTMKTAFSLMTGTSAQDANSYLQMYLSGSKQKVLDYHKPQIENIVTDLAASEDMRYPLNPDDWEEGLFIMYGKEVQVEDGHLRFKF